MNSILNKAPSTDMLVNDVSFSVEIGGLVSMIRDPLREQWKNPQNRYDFCLQSFDVILFGFS